MLSWHSCMPGSSGNSARRCLLTCCGAPPLSQQFAHHSSQLGVGLHPPRMMTAASSGRGPVRLERTVPLRAGVAAQLPGDRRLRPAHPGRDRRDGQAGLVKIRDRDPLVLRQVAGADLPHRQPLQRRHEADDLTASGRPSSRVPSCCRRCAIPRPRGPRPRCSTPSPAAARTEHAWPTTGAAPAPFHTSRQRPHTPGL